MHLFVFGFLWGAPLVALRGTTSFLWHLTGKPLKSSVCGLFVETPGEKEPLLNRKMMASSSVLIKSKDSLPSPAEAINKRRRQTPNSSKNTQSSFPSGPLKSLATEFFANAKGEFSLTKSSTANCSYTKSSYTNRSCAESAHTEPPNTRRRLRSASSSEPLDPGDSAGSREGGATPCGFGLQDAKREAEAPVGAGIPFAVGGASLTPEAKRPQETPGDSWADLRVSPKELRPSGCLTTGRGSQSFWSS